MTEDEYLEELDRLWPSDSNDATLEAMSVSETAVREYPDSAQLWRARGYLIHLAPDEYAAEVDDALACFKRALELDPADPETWEAIGYLYVVYRDEFAEAEKAFRMALQLGAGVDSYEGLARVLAQQGRNDEALAVLSGGKCPHTADAQIVKLRSEIIEGLWSR